MKAILPLTNKVRKAINDEVNRQTGENVRKLSVNIQALVLWALHQQFGFGKKRLLQFQEAFLPMIEELQEYYQAENAQETEFICMHKLKNEVGIDVESLGEMFKMAVKINK
jgi:hypothetical protein